MAGFKGSRKNTPYAAQIAADTAAKAAMGLGLKSIDVEEIDNYIKITEPPIHCCVILYTGDITPDAQEKILDKELGKDGKNVIIDIKLHPNLARRLICTHRVQKENPESIDAVALESVIRSIITLELNFDNKLDYICIDSLPDMIPQEIVDSPVGNETGYSSIYVRSVLRQDDQAITETQLHDDGH